MSDAVLGKILLGALTGGAGGAGGASGGFGAGGGGYGGPRGPSYCFLEQNNGFCGREGCTWMHKGGHFPGKRFADAEVQKFLCKELKSGGAVKKVGKLLKDAESESSSSDSESEKELRQLIKDEEAKKKKQKLKKQTMKMKAEKLEKKQKKSMKSRKKSESEDEESESEAEAAKMKRDKLKKKLKQKIKEKEEERADTKKSMKKLAKALKAATVDSTPANSDSDSDDDVPLGGRGELYSKKKKKKKEKKDVVGEDGTSKKKQTNKSEGKLTKYVKSGFSPVMKKLKTKGAKRRLFESELESDVNEMKTDDVFPRRREKLTTTEKETPAKSLGGLDMDEVCEYVLDYIQARTGAANTVFDETTDEELLHPVMMKKATKMLKKLADNFQVKSIGRKTHTTMLKDPSMQELVLTRVKEDWGDRGDGLGVFHNIVFNAADQMAHVANQKDLLMAASERLGLRKFDKDPEKMVVLIGVLTTCCKMGELDEAKANNEKKKTKVGQLSSSSSSSALSSDSDEDGTDSDEDAEQETDIDKGDKGNEDW